MNNKIKVYIVGGFVRDMLLNINPKDKDYVVIGSTPEDMVKLGYKSVGAEFPVFLHPQTGEEYALARLESKKGHGHKGFICNFDPNVTLEEDLMRRDITINAMAMDINCNIIDPYNGQKDLKNKVIRHIDDSFRDDPLRVLRVARFAAKLNFKIADETLMLMQDMAKSGELKYLTPERIFIELDKALSTDNPSIFFDVLRFCNALEILFPEIYKLINIPQPIEYHPEGDVYNHTMKALDLVKGNNINKFAILLHDVGKSLTPIDQLPKHINHDVNGLIIVTKFCNRLKVPNNYRKLALKVCKYHMKAHNFQKMKAGTIYKLLKGVGAFNNIENLYTFIACVEADNNSKIQSNINYLILVHCLNAANKIDTKEITNKYNGQILINMITQYRVLAIKKVLKEFSIF